MAIPLRQSQHQWTENEILCAGRLVLKFQGQVYASNFSNPEFIRTRKALGLTENQLGWEVEALRSNMPEYTKKRLSTTALERRVLALMVNAPSYVTLTAAMFLERLEEGWDIATTE